MVWKLEWRCCSLGGNTSVLEDRKQSWRVFRGWRERLVLFSRVKGEVDGSSGLSSRSAESVCVGCSCSECKRNCQYCIVTERQVLYQGCRSVALGDAWRVLGEDVDAVSFLHSALEWVWKRALTWLGKIVKSETGGDSFSQRREGLCRILKYSCSKEKVGSLCLVWQEWYD